MRNHKLRRVLRTLAILAVLGTGLSACIDHAEPVIVEPEGGALFERYVSLGNSITAGFQSGGIHVGFQRDAYPALLAEMAGASFGIPALAMPGCPPPLDGPLGEPISTAPCSVPPRVLNVPTLVQNLAVPGATTSDLSDPLGTGTPLNGFILGGRTQIDAMREADPTLVSVWIGNNDALGAALSGTELALTPLADFQAEYDEIVDAILDTDAQEAVLIGVADAAAVVPALQPGAYFYALSLNPPPGLPPLAVSETCNPFQGGAPNPAAFNLVSFIGVARAVAEEAFPITIDCVTGVQTSQPFDYLLDPAERTAISTRIAEFNGYIQAQADANGWIYVDPQTSLIGPALSDPNMVRKCQALATATDQASFIAAVLSSCPVDLDPTNDIEFFGSFFSYDGIHPSSMAHEAIADTLAGRLGL